MSPLAVVQGLKPLLIGTGYAVLKGRSSTEPSSAKRAAENFGHPSRICLAI